MKNCMHLREIPRKHITSGCERAGNPTDGHSVKQ